MRAVVRIALTCAVVLVAGCAHVPAPVLPEGAAAAVELTDVPFFPQEQHQCGPAALATVLHVTGDATPPSGLVGETFIPERRGSLQVELIAATRRHARVPYVLDPHLEALVGELEHGRPVLVLQNLGRSWIPFWHYAVVIGFSRADQTLVLRSGRTRRLVMPISEFDATWARAERWGLVVLRPGELPADVNGPRYLDSVVALERIGALDAALGAYESFVARFPNDATALFGLGNVAFELGDHRRAERAYRRLLVVLPGDALVLNNLATVLLAEGCVAAARRAIEDAETGLGTRERDTLGPVLRDTAAKISASGEPEEPSACGSLDLRSW